MFAETLPVSSTEGVIQHLPFEMELAEAFLVELHFFHDAPKKDLKI